MYSDENKELNKLQKELLSMMKEIDKICKENKIEYFILGGTFIGAVRHTGFIPWDDDIDIAMDRKNYDKFLNIVKEKLPSNMKLYHYKEEEAFAHWAKIVNTDFKIIEKYYNIEDEKYLFIDIFPFDNVPEAFIRKMFFKIEIYFKTKKIRIAKRIYLSDKYNIKFENKVKNMLLKLCNIKVLKNHFELQKVLEEYDALISKYKKKNTKLIANLCVNYDFDKIYRELFVKDRIKEIVDYDFEDTKLRGIKNYDYLLGQTFRDYMKLPPKEEQVSKHFVKLIDLRSE